MCKLTQQIFLKYNKLVLTWLRRSQVLIGLVSLPDSSQQIKQKKLAYIRTKLNINKHKHIQMKIAELEQNTVPRFIHKQ